MLQTVLPTVHLSPNTCAAALTHPFQHPTPAQLYTCADTPLTTPSATGGCSLSVGPPSGACGLKFSWGGAKCLSVITRTLFCTHHLCSCAGLLAPPRLHTSCWGPGGHRHPLPDRCTGPGAGEGCGAVRCGQEVRGLQRRRKQRQRQRHHGMHQDGEGSHPQHTKHLPVCQR